MRAFVALVRRSDAAPSDATLHDVARRVLPFRTADAHHERWTSADGRVTLVAWSNEPRPQTAPLIETSDGGAVGVSGYVHGAVPDMASLVDGPAPRLGGVWAFVGASETGVVALTCASGAEVVYVAETPDVVVVGNRALLVHLLACPTGPVPDLLGLAGVVSSGYCVTTRTAFEGVRALEPGARFRCDADGAVGTARYPTDDAAASVAEVTESLLASVSPLRTLDHPVRLGLTGGRDSRLLVALLTSAGVPVTTFTSGREGDPDVVVATEVARRLGVPHKVTPPMGATVTETAVTVDVRSRLREAVVLSEGMLSAYDRVGRIDDRFNARTVPFGGSGGEILRAYYAGSLADLDDMAEVERYMRSRLYSTAKRMTPAARSQYEQDTAPWLEAAAEHGAASLEDFYVRQRTGRWTGSVRAAASIGSLARRPYLDHLVVDAVRRVPLRERTSERLVADLLDSLAPELSDVRFAGRRWKFDDRPPEDAAERVRWEARAPVQGAHGDEAGLNWRTDLPEVRRELAAIIDAAPAAFWQLVDRRAVTDFLSPAEGRTRADTMKMWHLATLADALRHDFYVGEGKFQEPTTEIVAALPSPSATPPRSGRTFDRARAAVRRLLDRHGSLVPGRRRSG